jgi:hypothetical protein
MIKIFCAAGVMLFAGLYLSAQQKYTLSGTIKEKKSGEVLIGASVYLLELPNAGVISNSYGFYSITAPRWSIHHDHQLFGFCRIPLRYY